MRRSLLLATALLAATAGATLAFPHAMVSPGDLVKGHDEIETDCLACHLPFGGPDDRCAGCHEVAKIDEKRADRPPFHAALAAPRCSGCHTDHRGRDAGAAVREFRHDLLRADRKEACDACHAAPADDLHRQVREGCATCHSTAGWQPATFDHTRYFRFDGDHPAECRTCHPSGFKAFTCYGCHDHQPAEIERKHRKEGLVPFDKCAECHRSADEHEAKGRREGREHEED